MRACINACIHACIHAFHTQFIHSSYVHYMCIIYIYTYIYICIHCALTFALCVPPSIYICQSIIIFTGCITPITCIWMGTGACRIVTRRTAISSRESGPTSCLMPLYAYTQLSPQHVALLGARPDYLRTNKANHCVIIWYAYSRPCATVCQPTHCDTSLVNLMFCCSGCGCGCG